MIATTRTLALLASLSGLALLAGCGGHDSAGGTAAKQEMPTISATVQKAIAEAKQKIAEGNINIQDGKSSPQVELSPKGDLIIDGKPVPVTAEQRALLVDYRGRIAAVASAGVDIGLQGADLATRAVTQSLKGVFTGNTDEIDKQVEAEADKVRVAAIKLCDLLPAMKVSQDKVAASVPEFRPYANLDQSDIDECRDDVNANAKGKKNTATAAAEAVEAAAAAAEAVKQ
ncbi:hypothetical protein ACFOLC_01210 [Lysobacter cavernae]|uniref:DUF2884 family protein n=1 Tax=Lysobacter cavernae TaxID=1685901 RepID=A0ABV7RJ58_9GAMM